MNLDSLSFALSEISYSVANLTKKNFKASVTEITHLVAKYGPEADRHLFRCLFSYVDFNGDGKSSGKDFHQTQLLIQEFGNLLSRPNFISILVYAIDNPLHLQNTLKPSVYLFSQISKVLKLSCVHEVILGLALFKSAKLSTQTYATQFVRQKLPDLIRSYVDAVLAMPCPSLTKGIDRPDYQVPENYTDTSSSEGGIQNIGIELLHLLLSHLFQDKEQFGIGSEQTSAFLNTLRKDFPRDRAPVILVPLLYPDTDDIEMDKLSEIADLPKSTNDNSLADMILEAGYSVTSSVEECRNMLIQFGGAKEITPSSIARTLGMMAKTHNSLADSCPGNGVPGGGGGLGGGGSIWGETKEKPGDTWNVDVFVQVVQELALMLNWREVVNELDYPGFVIPNKRGLGIVMHGLLRPLHNAFPIESLYRPWKNTDGQLSLIIQALRNPDVFCFADYLRHTVVIDILKAAPDDDNREIATWKSLDLCETLLHLSEQGHYQQVSELFNFPINNCPDMLVLALLKITDTSWNTLKQELISSLMPIFLGNHPNSAIVLHYAWHYPGHSSTIRTLIMHSMAEWYMRGEPHDQTRLSRILDVAQDLKALSMLLNATPFAFVIDLGCLASRREYLKLDKWLSDKIREHREPFILACVTFLKRRCPQLLGGIVNKEDQPPLQKSQQLPAEIVATMLTCLRAYASQVSQELTESIMAMVANASLFLNKPAPVPPNVPGIIGPQNTLQAVPPKNPMEPFVNIGSLQGLAGAGVNPAAPFSQTAGPVNAAPGSPAKAAFPGLSTGGISQVMSGGGMSAGVMSQGLPGVALSQSLQGGTISQALQGGTISQALQGGTISQALQGGAISQALQGGAISQALQGGSLAQGLSPAIASVSQGISQPGVAPPPFSMGSLSSQLQNMSVQTSLASVIPGNHRTPVSTVGNMSAQALKQQPGAAERIRPATTAGDVSSILPEMNQQFSKEVEDEANQYFQRIYDHPPHPTMSTDEVLDMLKRFKDSQNQREREVYACMLRSLLEEYKFFPQYPEKELHTTAVLFGGIIEQGLVTYMLLGFALRYVLEALRKPFGSKMYFFGIAALDRFKTRLKDYPQYCQHLTAIPHFAQFPQHLIDYVEYGARSQEPPHHPQGSVTSRTITPVFAALPMPSSTANMSATEPTEIPMMPVTNTFTLASATTTVTTVVAPTTASASSAVGSRPSVIPKPSIANTTNIDTLLAGQGKEEISVPPEALQDKVFFIFNNLSLSNMTQKSEELKESISEDYVSWTAQYLVMKRASIEPNFHTLYANFIDALQIGDFTGMVTNETFRNIKVLLRSDKGVTNYSDRALLKNLGHWLGMLTLAKNKPILQIDIDLKALLYEAYHKSAQELLYVVPFTAKVIESCAKSKVFKPPNPWTMGIMNVLAELHQEPDLKLNLKFEVEVLCKNLGIDISDLKPVVYLRDTSRLSYLQHQLSGTHKVPPAIMMPPPADQVGKLPGVGPEIIPITTTLPAATLPPQPQFSLDDINVSSLTGLAPHITISEHPLFHAHPQLKPCVRAAVERSVQDLLPPLVERAIKIALTTCEQIIKKDFALDPDENRMRVAAHRMVRNMTAGLTLITCREPLFMNMSSNLKSAFTSALRGLTPAQKDMVDQAAQLVTQDNVELTCAFVQKTAIERAIPEMDKRLATEFEFRKHARTEGRRYCDTAVLTYQAERMPEQIALKVGGVTTQQIAVYDEFARNIPGFMPSVSETAMLTSTAKPPNLFTSNDEVTQIYDKVIQEMKNHLQHMIGLPPTNVHISQLHGLLDAAVLARNTRDVVTALTLLQKAVEGLLDHYTGSETELMARFRDCHLMVLTGLQDARAYGPQWTNKQVTRFIMDSRDERKYNGEAVDCLIRSHLVHLQQLDSHLVMMMDNGMNYMAVAFSMQIVQRYCVDEKQQNPKVTEADFFNTIEALGHVVNHPRHAPDGLAALLETIRQNSSGGPASMMQTGILQARQSFDDPPGLHDKTEYLLREWVNMYHSPAAGRDSTKAFSSFVAQMHQQGILKTDDLITRFFRLCTEMCVDLCYRALSEQTQSPTLIRAKCFHTLDAYVRLIALLVKHSGDTTNTVTKINLLNKVLGIVAGVLLQDHEVRQSEFQQLPYHRIFIMLFIELNAPDHILESINFQVLNAFCNTLHILRPAKAPAFSYAWLELVSHRVFIGRILALTPQQRGWTMYAQLLIDLFKFLSPFLRNAEFTKPTQLLYKGTLRVLLVLLHDFPEFLCDCHYAFCDVIPPNCIQMRNLILSAFPRQMRLPDPFTQNLKVDTLPEIALPPRILTNFANLITPAAFKKDLDSYLKTRSPVTFLTDLRSNLQTNQPGLRYNIPLINALVLYVGTQAIAYIHSKGLTPSMSTIAHSSHMDIFQSLSVDIDTAGRYLFLNAMANQLRYPNSHTHYFSCALLYLFAEANTEAIQEQITRVLLERLIVNRPHPWGLLITFIELIKNPQFKFWSHEFVHCAPEIEKLFETVARSFMQTKPAQTVREQEVTSEIH